MFLPAVALAANDVQNGLSGVRSLFPGSGLAGSTSLTGPNGLLVYVIQILLLLSGIVAVLFVIVGGFWYITSAGNEEQAEKGRKTLVNAIIGVVIIVLAYVIISVIVNLVSNRSV